MGPQSARVDRSTLRTLLSAGTPAAVCRRTVGTATREVDAEWAVLALAHGEALEAAQIAGQSEGEERPRRWSDPTDRRVQVFQHGESVLVDDLHDTRSALQAPASVRSLLCVPVGELGVLFVESTEVGAFDETDRAWLEQLAADVAMALDRFEEPTEALDAVTTTSDDSTTPADRLGDRFPFVLEVTDSVLWQMAVESRQMRLFGPVERLLGNDGRSEYELQTFVDSYVHPADVDRVVDAVDAVQEGQRRGIDVEYRIELDTVDDVRWVQTRAAIEDDGNAELVGLSTDVTEQRSRERRIKHLQQRTTRLIGADSRTDIANIAVNAAGEALTLPMSSLFMYEDDRLEPAAFNQTAWEEFDGHRPVPTDSDRALDQFFWEAFEDGRPVTIEDTATSDRFGETPAIRSVIVYPLSDHGVFVAASREPDAFGSVDVALGEVLAMGLVAALDRSEHERRLQEQTEELERKNERLEEFTSIVSHDLRNPLNVALGRVEYVRDRLDGEHPHMETVETALERMATIIDETLVLARQGYGVDATEQVAVVEMIEQCWQNVETENASSELDFDDERLTIEADRERLAHVFENLFRNAVDHGGDDVRIRIGDLPDGLYVEDDGPGIPLSERKQVFEAGYTTEDDGTGFGLSLVRDIVEAHGWQIDVREGSLGGARFEITEMR